MSIKNTIIALFLVSFLMFSSVSALADDYSAISNDATITRAISLTKSINNSVISVLLGANTTRKPINVKFANLSSISPYYMNADAITIIGDDGRMTIYIDIAHKNSPPEAIACLLEHETTHNDASSSIEEEVIAWTKEATTWNHFVKNNPSLSKLDESKYPLIDRLNYLSELYKNSGNTSSAIRKEILSNGFYTNLSMHSVGY